MAEVTERADVGEALLAPRYLIDGNRRRHRCLIAVQGFDIQEGRNTTRPRRASRVLYRGCEQTKNVGVRMMFERALSRQTPDYRNLRGITPLPGYTTPPSPAGNFCVFWEQNHLPPGVRRIPTPSLKWMITRHETATGRHWTTSVA